MTASIRRAHALATASLLSCLLLVGCDDEQGPDSQGATDTGGDDTDGDDTDGDDTTGDTTTGDAVDEPDIAGTYVEEFPGGMASHTIDGQAWLTDYGDGEPVGYDLQLVDNDAQFVVGQSTTQASDYAKLQWTFDGDDLYYCTVVFDAASAEEAAAADPADDANPAEGGCSDFPWSRLVAQ